MDDDPNDFGPMINIGRIDINKAVSDLMSVTKVALGEGMPEVSEAEAIALLRRMLTVVDRAMPPELQAQDPRVEQARAVLAVLRAINRPACDQVGRL